MSETRLERIATASVKKLIRPSVPSSPAEFQTLARGLAQGRAHKIEELVGWCRLHFAACVSRERFHRPPDGSLPFVAAAPGGLVSVEADRRYAGALTHRTVQLERLLRKSRFLGHPDHPSKTVALRTAAGLLGGFLDRVASLPKPAKPEPSFLLFRKGPLLIIHAGARHNYHCRGHCDFLHQLDMDRRCHYR